MKTRIIAAALAMAAAFAAAPSAYATTWTYSSAAKTITDGRWTLKVSSFDKEAGTIAFSGSAVSNCTSSGVLDLRAPLVVKDASGSTTVKAVNLGGSAFANAASITEFYCDIIGSMGVNCFSSDTKMTKIEIGGTADNLPCPLFSSCTSLVTAKLDFPNLRRVGTGSGQLFGGTELKITNLKSIDVSTVAGPGVVSIRANALASKKLSGALVLTNATTLGSSAFKNAALTSVSLSGSLRSLPSESFLGSATITNVVLDLPQLTSVAANAFSGQSKIRRVELASRPLYMGLVTNIVAAASNTSASELVVSVSTNQWKASAAETYSETNTNGFFTAIAAAEKSSYPAGAFGVLVVKGKNKGVFVHKTSGAAAAAITRSGRVVKPEYNPDSTSGMRISNDAKTAFVNLAHVSEKGYQAMAERAFMLMEKAADAKKGGDKRPLMGWSSWNAFGVNVTEAAVVGVAKAMATNGLKAAGYTYVNIDSGAFSGRDTSGNLTANATRFPNGLASVVSSIHALGLKAGIYSDIGSDAYNGSGSKVGSGIGFYNHDAQDAKYYFSTCGFDFIKVDCRGGEKLGLDEYARYTAIRSAIDKVKSGVRMNVCHRKFPGRWAALVADSWRTTSDIAANWSSVSGIIVSNLYLTQYPSLGHYNDMDMLEVGNGLTSEQDRTHFGMWCFMSSPLVLGCDVREMDATTRELVTNPFLLGMNQNDLGATVGPVLRKGSCMTFVKDCDTIGGTARYLALYNGDKNQTTFDVDFPRLDVGGKVRFFDLMERTDAGEYKQSASFVVPAYGAKFFRLDAEFRPSASNNSSSGS